MACLFVRPIGTLRAAVLDKLGLAFFFFFFFYPSHSSSSPFFFLSLLVVTQIQGHIAGTLAKSHPYITRIETRIENRIENREPSRRHA